MRLSWVNRITLEDIIKRGGATLAVELYGSEDGGRFAEDRGERFLPDRGE